MKANIMRVVHGTAQALEIKTMIQTRILTQDDIEAVVARAREDRAQAIRTGAASLSLILQHFLTDLRRTPARA